ncbi:MAG: hypothetical protein IH996_05700, partial [Proteobacteria bacterium]|nr:hypothetical protein [Pseudomonadota bacterium]
MPDLHEYPPTPRVNGPGNAAPSSHLGLDINSGRITPPPALCIDGGGFRDQKPRFGALGDAAASDAVLAALIEKYEQISAYNIAYVLALRGEVD